MIGLTADSKVGKSVFSARFPHQTIESGKGNVNPVPVNQRATKTSAGSERIRKVRNLNLAKATNYNRGVPPHPDPDRKTRGVSQHRKSMRPKLRPSPPLPKPAPPVALKQKLEKHKPRVLEQETPSVVEARPVELRHGCYVRITVRATGVKGYVNRFVQWMSFGEISFFLRASTTPISSMRRGGLFIVKTSGPNRVSGLFDFPEDLTICGDVEPNPGPAACTLLSREFFDAMVHGKPEDVKWFHETLRQECDELAFRKWKTSGACIAYIASSKFWRVIKARFACPPHISFYMCVLRTVYAIVSLPIEVQEDGTESDFDVDACLEIITATCAWATIDQTIAQIGKLVEELEKADKGEESDLDHDGSEASAPSDAESQQPDAVSPVATDLTGVRDELVKPYRFREHYPCSGACTIRGFDMPRGKWCTEAAEAMRRVDSYMVAVCTGLTKGARVHTYESILCNRAWASNPHTCKSICQLGDFSLSLTPSYIRVVKPEVRIGASSSDVLDELVSAAGVDVAPQTLSFTVGSAPAASATMCFQSYISAIGALFAFQGCISFDPNIGIPLMNATFSSLPSSLQPQVFDAFAAWPYSSYPGVAQAFDMFTSGSVIPCYPQVPIATVAHLVAADHGVALDEEDPVDKILSQVRLAILAARPVSAPDVETVYDSIRVGAHGKERALELLYDDGSKFSLPTSFTEKLLIKSAVAKALAKCGYKGMSVQFINGSIYVTGSLVGGSDSGGMYAPIVPQIGQASSAGMIPSGYGSALAATGDAGQGKEITDKLGAALSSTIEKSVANTVLSKAVSGLGVNLPLAVARLSAGWLTALPSSVANAYKAKQSGGWMSALKAFAGGQLRGMLGDKVVEVVGSMITMSMCEEAFEYDPTLAVSMAQIVALIMIGDASVATTDFGITVQYAAQMWKAFPRLTLTRGMKTYPIDAWMGSSSYSTPFTHTALNAYAAAVSWHVNSFAPVMSGGRASLIPSPLISSIKAAWASGTVGDLSSAFKSFQPGFFTVSASLGTQILRVMGVGDNSTSGGLVFLKFLLYCAAHFPAPGENLVYPLDANGNAAPLEQQKVMIDPTNFVTGYYGVTTYWPYSSFAVNALPVVNAWFASMETFVQLANGAAIAGFPGIATWDVTAAVVPVVAAIANDPILMAIWTLLHMRYPWRLVSFGASINNGVSYATKDPGAAINTLPHAIQSSVEGPVQGVLFVAVDSVAAASPIAYQIALGAGVVLDVGAGVNIAAGFDALYQAPDALSQMNSALRKIAAWMPRFYGVDGWIEAVNIAASCVRRPVPPLVQFSSNDALANAPYSFAGTANSTADAAVPVNMPGHPGFLAAAAPLTWDGVAWTAGDGLPMDTFLCITNPGLALNADSPSVTRFPTAWPFAKIMAAAGYYIREDASEVLPEWVNSPFSASRVLHVVALHQLSFSSRFMTYCPIPKSKMLSKADRCPPPTPLGAYYTTNNLVQGATYQKGLCSNNVFRVRDHMRSLFTLNAVLGRTVPFNEWGWIGTYLRSTYGPGGGVVPRSAWSNLTPMCFQTVYNHMFSTAGAFMPNDYDGVTAELFKKDEAISTQINSVGPAMLSPIAWKQVRLRPLTIRDCWDFFCVDHNGECQDPMLSYTPWYANVSLFEGTTKSLIYIPSQYTRVGAGHPLYFSLPVALTTSTVPPDSERHNALLIVAASTLDFVVANDLANLVNQFVTSIDAQPRLPAKNQTLAYLNGRNPIHTISAPEGDEVVSVGASSIIAEHQ